MVKAIPMDRLLIESDAPDQPPSIDALRRFLNDHTPIAATSDSINELTAGDGTLRRTDALQQLFRDLLSPDALAHINNFESHTQADPNSTASLMHAPTQLENECSIVLFVLYMYCCIKEQQNDPFFVRSVINAVSQNGHRVFNFKNLT